MKNIYACYWLSFNYGASWTRLRATSAEGAKKAADRHPEVKDTDEVMLGRPYTKYFKIHHEWTGYPGIKRRRWRMVTPLPETAPLYTENVTPITK